MPSTEPPALPEQSIVCSLAAARRYDIPAEVMLAVAEKEAGRPGQRVRNRNGSEDLGPMQFNSGYVATLAGHGILPSHVLGHGCYPFQLAAWRIRGHLANDVGDIWTRAANYHSRTPSLNLKYRTDLELRAGKWRSWLASGQTTSNDKPPDTVRLPTTSYLPRSIALASGR
jgi:hypothetical protein